LPLGREKFRTTLRMDLEKELSKGRNNRKANKKLASHLLRKKPKGLDEVAHELHDEAFEHIDCLDCGNCCKTTSPGMHDKDIERLAKHFRIKPAELIEKHMELDREGEYVFRSAPCPFLGEDNKCSVYESRPLACREYPHTNRKRFYQVAEISVRNTTICPAVVRILDGLRQVYLK